MSNRDKPYLWNTPTNVVQLISVASRISLYLVDQSDVMDFTFKDRLGKVNSVHIGARVYCTCQQKMEHCFHSIYVLLKVFKLPADNPLLWQVSYLESQVIDIITGKYSVQKVNQMVVSTVIQNPVKIQKDKNNQVQRLKINGQSVCSICQESMKSQMSLSYCRTGCGNNFHTNCLKIWIDHKQGTQGKVTCPMCRCEYNKQNLQSIIKEQQIYLKKQHKVNITKEKFSCQQCSQKPIASNIYKCLFCEMFCLCQQCFQNKKHLKHPFVQFENGQWKPAPRKQNTNISQDEQFKQQYITLFDYIVDSYPYVSKYLSQNIDQNRKLKFSVEQCKCFSCANDKILFLRRLPCGHYVDDACAKDLISKNKMYCFVDGSKFLKGYQNLLKIDEQVNKKVQSTLKQQTVQREEFLEQKISQYSSDDYQEQILNSLHDIIGVSQEPIVVPVESQVQKNIVRNVQHLPPIIKKKTQSVIKSLMKQTTFVRNISIQLQKKKPFSSKIIKSSSIKSNSQNKHSEIKGSMKRMFF